MLKIFEGEMCYYRHESVKSYRKNRLQDCNISPKIVQMAILCLVLTHYSLQLPNAADNFEKILQAKVKFGKYLKQELLILTLPAILHQILYTIILDFQVIVISIIGTDF